MRWFVRTNARAARWMVVLWWAVAAPALAQDPAGTEDQPPVDAASPAEPDAATGAASAGGSDAPEPAAVGSAPDDTPVADEAELAALEAELAAELGGDTGDHAPGVTAVSREPVDHGTGSALGRVLMLPDISVVLTAGAFYFSDLPTPRFPAHEPVHSRDGLKLQLQELELAIQSAVDPYFRADVYLAFGLEGVELEEAIFTTLGLPGGLQLRVGWFYQRFGRFNPQHFLETSPFVDMPLANRRFFGGEQLKGLGAELSWLLPLPWFAELSASFVTAGNEVSLGLPIDETGGPEDFLTVFRLDQFFPLSDTWSLSVGASAAQAPNNAGGPAATKDNRTTLFGGDIYLRWRDLSSIRYATLTVEYIARRALLPGGRQTEGGLYAQVDLRLHQRLAIALRGDVFGLPSSASGSPVATGELAPWYARSDQWRVAAALSFYASEFHRWRLQYGLDRVLAGDAGVVPTRDPVHEVALQYQFVLGSHGAHPF